MHNAFNLAQRFVGIRERSAFGKDHPFIVWCLEGVGLPEGVQDEVPWCGAFASRIAWMLRLPRAKTARAREWLSVGVPLALTEARAENDVVILKRGGGDQPGPEVLEAPGHVGFFAGIERNPLLDRRALGFVLVLGGNQGDSVSIQRFPADRVLGVRRLAS